MVNSDTQYFTKALAQVAPGKQVSELTVTELSRVLLRAQELKTVEGCGKLSR